MGEGEGYLSVVACDLEELDVTIEQHVKEYDGSRGGLFCACIWD